VVVVEEVREVSKRLGFSVVAKPLKLDANKKVTAGRQRRRWCAS